MPIAIDRRLQNCSDEDLRLLMKQLFEYWEFKGHAPVDQMPRHWVRDVKRLRAEIARRGVQLSLW